MSQIDQDTEPAESYEEDGLIANEGHVKQRDIPLM